MLALTLAVVAVSANAVQFQAEAGLAAGSLLLVDRGQQLVRQDANVSVSKPTPPAVKLSVGIKFKKTTTPSPMTGKEDEETKDKFIRECTVTFLTSNPELLPVKTLEAFCSKTDAVVECRLRVVEELKKARKTEGGIGLWCRDSFAWFQKKYGGKCPVRCEKLMCKASCKWLKIKAKIDDNSMKLDKTEATADTTKKTLYKETGVVRDLKAAAQKGSRELTKAKTEMTFQDGNLKEASDKSKKAAAATKKASDKAALWTKKLAMAVAEAKKISLELRDVTGKESLAMQDLTNKNKDVAAQKTVVAGVKKLIKDGSKKKAALDLVLKAKEKKLAAAQKVVKDKLDPQIAANKTKVEHWKTMVGKAEVQVKQVKDKKSPQKTMAAAEDLLRQQQKRKQDALDALAKAELEKTKATTDIKLQTKAINAQKKKITDAAKAILTMNTQKATQSGKLATLTATAATAKTKQQTLMKAKAAKIIAMKKATKAVEKATVTLKFVKQGQTESKAALGKATAEKKAVAASHGLAKSGLKTATAKSIKATKTHKTSSEKLKKSNKVLDGVLKKLSTDKKALQKELNKHIRVKPEIVAQHNLGL